MTRINKNCRHRVLLIEKDFVTLQSKFPQFGLYMVGSTLNGFGTDDSDVDMCLIVRETAFDPRSDAVYRLNQIMSCLKRSG